MAFENSGIRIPGVIAAADLSAKQFYFVEMTTTGANLAGDGALALGVLQNKPTAGQACEIETASVSKVVAGAAIALGANVSSDSAGKAKTSATGNYIQGEALIAALADGDIISVALTKPGRLA